MFGEKKIEIKYLVDKQIYLLSVHFFQVYNISTKFLQLEIWSHSKCQDIINNTQIPLDYVFHLTI